MISFVSGEAGVPDTRGFRVLGWEAGVPDTRGFRGLGWDADHAPSHLPQGTENSEPNKAVKAVWSESDRI